MDRKITWKLFLMALLSFFILVSAMNLYAGLSKTVEVAIITVKKIKAEDSDNSSNFMEDTDKAVEAEIKTVYVGKKDTGTVNITVEPVPTVSETDLPSGWKIEKVSGTLNFDGTPGKIDAKVKKDTAGDIVVKVIPCSGSTDHFQVKIVVVEVDIDTDSNNDGAINDTDDPESDPLFEENAPGRIIIYNGDDDNGNSTPDREDTGTVSGENDLAMAKLSYKPNTLPNGFKIVLEASIGGGNIKIWESSTKGTEISLPKTYVIGTHMVPATIYIEGYNTGEAMFDVIAKTDTDKEIIKDKIKITVVEVDIDTDSNNDGSINDTDDPQSDPLFEENAPGRIVLYNGDDDNDNSTPDCNDTGTVGGENDLAIAKLSHKPATLPNGFKIVIEASSGGGYIKIWESSTKGTEISLPKTYIIGSHTVPATIYIEGYDSGESMLDMILKTGSDKEISRDKIKITVRTKVKLGQTSAASPAYTMNPGFFQVYVPTKWGGKLNITVSAGALSELKYPDGSSYTNGNETGEGKHGWYTFKVSGSAGYMIGAGFEQVGTASTTPWNGWYWPKLDTVNPNLYDTTGAYTPLKDYDTVYGTTETASESANYSGGSGWEGHCWGWSLAAIAMSQPSATIEGGVSFNQDEMEGLYTELAEGATTGWTWRIGTPSAPIPASPCTAATGEAIDAWPDDLHNGFRTYIRQQGKAMNANLRDASVPLSSTEVWNHDIYIYKATMQEASGSNVKKINVTTVITSNLDTPAMPADGTSRSDTYIYILEYKNDGTIDGTSANQNWISCTSLPPKDIGTVEGPLNWQGEHCGITKANVDALY